MVGEDLRGRSGVAGEEPSVLWPEKSQPGQPLPVGHFPGEAGEIRPWGKRDSMQMSQWTQLT